MTPVTLIRSRSKDTPPGIITYAAIRSSDAVELLAGLNDDQVDTDTLPWDALPGVEPLAAAELAASPAPRAVIVLGTTQDGEWATWHPPVTPPPVPQPQKEITMTGDDWKVIGHAGIDSGHMILVDPCNAREAATEWDEYVTSVEALPKGAPMPPAPTLRGLATITQTGWGDGSYEVQARYADGRVAEIRVVFLDDPAPEKS